MRCANPACKGIMRPLKWAYHNGISEEIATFYNATFWIPTGPLTYKEVQPMACDKCGSMVARKTGKVQNHV